MTATDKWAVRAGCGELTRANADVLGAEVHAIQAREHEANIGHSIPESTRASRCSVWRIRVLRPMSDSTLAELHCRIIAVRRSGSTDSKQTTTHVLCDIICDGVVALTPVNSRSDLAPVAHRLLQQHVKENTPYSAG